MMNPSEKCWPVNLLLKCGRNLIFFISYLFLTSFFFFFEETQTNKKCIEHFHKKNIDAKENEAVPVQTYCSVVYTVRSRLISTVPVFLSFCPLVLSAEWLTKCTTVQPFACPSQPRIHVKLNIYLLSVVIKLYGISFHNRNLIFIDSDLRIPFIFLNIQIQIQAISHIISVFKMYYICQLKRTKTLFWPKNIYL